MQIISNFRDYYDCIAKQGVDTTLKYFRKTEILEIPYKLPYSPSGLVKTRIVGFCGRLYPLVYLVDEELNTETLISCIEEIDAWVHSFYKKRELETYYKEQYRGFKFWLRFNRKKRGLQRKYFESLFDEINEIKDNPPIYLLDFFISNSCPIFSIRQKDTSVSNLIINDQLSKFQFEKVVDPYTAFQELSMFIGGMAAPEKPIPAIDDKTMAEAKGFNKYSFRKDKSK